MSEADVSSMTIESEPSHQYSITLWGGLKVTIHNTQLKAVLWKPPLDPSVMTWYQLIFNIRTQCMTVVNESLRAGNPQQRIWQLPWSWAAWKTLAQQLLSLSEKTKQNCRISATGKCHWYQKLIVQNFTKGTVTTGIFQPNQDFYYFSPKVKLIWPSILLNVMKFCLTCSANRDKNIS